MKELIRAKSSAISIAANITLTTLLAAWMIPSVSIAADTKTRLGGINLKLNGGYYVTDYVKLGLGLSYQPKGLNFDKKNGYSYSALRAIANVHYYFMPENKVTPFVMGGVGVARNKLYWHEQNSKASGHSTSASYEVGGGVALQLSDSISASIGYKLANMPSVTMKDVSNTAITWKTKSSYQHNISLGLNYVF